MGCAGRQSNISTAKELEPDAVGDYPGIKVNKVARRELMLLEITGAYPCMSA